MKLRCENLVKKYGPRTVVKGVSMEVEQGEIVGFLGPNGAGKTTSFYMITGLIVPNAGKIFLDDEDICNHEEYVGKRIKRGLYKASDGRLINADVNGALNILKKVIGKFEYDSIKVCSTPLVVTP